MSDRCYPVLVFWSLGSLLLATGAALRIHTLPAIDTEETTGNVNITCNLDDKDLDVQRILKIGFSKDNCNTLVSLVGSTISYDDANYADTNKYHASGSIEEEVGRSYLSLSILQPDQSESGVYTCVVEYLTKDTMFGELQASSSLTVKGLDLKELVKTLTNELSDVKEQLNQQELNQQESRDNVACFFNAQKLYQRGSHRGTIVHNKVIAMLGLAYDSNTGIFTAPVHGVYAFNVKFMINCGDCTVSLQIFHGEKPMCSAYVTRKLYGESSGSCVMEMKKGETADVRQTWGDGGLRKSTFSGYLVKALY